MKIRSLLFALLLPWSLLACDEEPIIIGPQSSDDDMGSSSGGAGGTGGEAGSEPEMPPVGAGGAAGAEPPDDPGGPGGAGGQPPPAMLEPDIELFHTLVAPPLYDACALCHRAAVPDPRDPVYDVVDGGPAGLSPEQRQLNVDEAMAFLTFDDPAQSPLLVYHPPGDPNHVPPGSALYRAVLDWMDDAVPEPMVDPDPIGAGGDGGDGGEGGGEMVGGVPCDGIPPPGSPAGRSQAFRDAYEAVGPDGDSINDMLVQSCGEAEYCHGTQAVGGGYWILDDLDDACAIQWNYLVAQWFVDPANVDASPLLTQPRAREHGGRVVFRGRDDPRHVRLLLWIENEFAGR